MKYISTSIIGFVVLTVIFAVIGGGFYIINEYNLLRYIIVAILMSIVCYFVGDLALETRRVFGKNKKTDKKSKVKKMSYHDSL